MEPIAPNLLVVTGRVTRAAVPGLCAELEALLYDPDGSVRDPDTGVDCDVGGVVHVDLALVEAVARLGLVARRAGGRRLRLRNVPPELRSLLDLVGLADVVDVGCGTGTETETGTGAGTATQTEETGMATGVGTAEGGG